MKCFESGQVLGRERKAKREEHLNDDRRDVDGMGNEVWEEMLEICCKEHWNLRKRRFCKFLKDMKSDLRVESDKLRFLVYIFNMLKFLGEVIFYKFHHFENFKI